MSRWKQLEKGGFPQKERSLPPSIGGCQEDFGCECDMVNFRVRLTLQAHSPLASGEDAWRFIGKRL
jgi:hypothetical protein